MDLKTKAFWKKIDFNFDLNSRWYVNLSKIYMKGKKEYFVLYFKKACSEDNLL